MAKVGTPLSKRSVVVDLPELREWVRMGRFRTESEAVRAAVAQAVAIGGMKEAVASIRRRRTFARPAR
jgi:Arc/MetJ-type ribon-helix-helix transcriptional regulator